MTSLTRFSQIAAEEGIVKDPCPECGTSMTTGKFPRTMEMQYCSQCNKFRPKGRDNDDDRTSREDSGV
jgi:predicted RNA-binding Zn-ribbon protein involved in translation (DUF1610 family)